MNKIAAVAAVILIGTVVGGPAALAQTSTANSGAGVPGLPGNKFGPALRPGEQFNVRTDLSNVPGLPGNKSGPALQPPTGLQNRARFCNPVGGCNAGPDLLPGSPGTLLRSVLTLNCSPGRKAGPNLFPGKPGTPAPLFAVLVCARAAGPPTTVPIKITAATAAILFMVYLHWMPDQYLNVLSVRKNRA